MSRTKRNKRPRMHLGNALAKQLNKDGTVRDGTPTHNSKSCEHHGGCVHCLSNRTHKHKRNEPIGEE